MVNFFKKPNVIKGFRKGTRIVALFLPSDPIGLLVKVTLVLLT